MQSFSTLAFLFNRSVKALMLAGSLLAFNTLSAQLVTFPGAEGAGRFTSGGRGTPTTLTTVFEVINLNDDNNPGSLRYALQASSSTYLYRTVVFRVSGTIHLLSALHIKSNITIAGQTAPGGGICLADYPVIMSGDNILVRYIRFRMGDKNQNASLGNDDSFDGIGHKNIMIDHCTMSWSDDEAFTVYGGDSTSLQWNFISEPLNYSYHDEGAGIQNHGYGGIQGGRHISIHHNLFAHCESRTPRFDGTRNIAPYTAGLENVDFVNNVIYNWGINNVYGGEGGNYNLVNNYYKYGPSTNNGVKYRVANPYKQTSTPVIPYGKYFINGNYIDGSTTNTNNNWRGVTMDGGTNADTSLAKVITPFNVLGGGISTQAAVSAYDLVLLNAGATYPTRDTLDQRIANDVRYRTGRIIDVQGGYPHLTPYPQTVNAWPNLASTPAPTDTDHDGMPDSWENTNGLNPNNPADRGAIASNGYTNLENYLNGITTTASLSVNGNLTGFSQTVGSPSSFQSYTVTGTNLTTPVTVTPPANYQVSADASTWYGTSTPLSIPLTSGTVSSTVYVRLNATAAGSYSGNIANTSSSITQNISVDGIAVVAPAGINVIVAQDGTGNYTTVQAAINAAPTALTAPYVIFIKNGKYREKITIPSNKPFIQLVGESVANTILYYDDPATVLGTSGSASITINAPDFSAMNITFANTYGDGSQGVAVLVNADRAAFKNCRFMGNQDTLYVKGAANPRAYFRNCYVDGNVDFIFGGSIAVFDSCIIYPKTRVNATGSSYITAANTPATGQSYGLVFRNCKIADNTGATSYYLGRPWQNTSATTPLPFNRTTFLNTTMGYTILPVGWSVWDVTTNTANIDYGEYQSIDFTGAPVNTSSRVSWSQQLTGTQAANYTNANLFGSWDPCTVAANFCTSQPASIAVSNFRGTKGQISTALEWNPSWAITGVKYELYRSTVKTSGYIKINEALQPNDTTYNFLMTDALPSSGTAFYYYVLASKAGMASHITDTVQISNVQTINVVGTLTPFAQNVGTPSASQQLTVSAANLTDSITITPPAYYEVSLNGATWYNNSNPLVIPEVGGAVAATPVSIRLNSPSLGTWGGNIIFSSPGANSVSVPVTGTTSLATPVTQTVLEWWPMSFNNIDSAAVRSAGVAATVPTLNRLFVADGSVAAVQPYSPTLGQALSSGTTGAGTWSSASGGPGGNLNRNVYEQFKIKANSNYSVRVDSFLITAAFYATASGTKLGVVYSRSAFTTDSSDVTTTPGIFTNPILLAQQNTGPTNQYALALNGATGVTLNPGDSLTIRIYLSCSSSSLGRYGLVKNVIAKGLATNLAVPTPVITTSVSSLPAFNQTVGIPSASQTYTVSGANLTDNIYVLAPANYEVSLNGTTWNNNITPIVLAPTTGTVATTTIYVRLNAASGGTYAGNVQNISNGAITKNVAVTGTAIASPIILTSGTLTTFSQNVGSPSATQTYTVSGLSLTGPVTITPPANYEVSADGGATWFNNATPLVLTPTGSTLASTTITVRLNAATSGVYNGNIVHVSSGATTVNVAVNGITAGSPTLVVTGTLNPFSQTVGTPSAVQTYTIAGVALSGTVTITPPANYEVSADGGATWFTSASPLVLTPVAGSLGNTTIGVRLNAAVPGTSSGNIVNSSSGATSVNVAVTGTTVGTPVLVVTAALTNFSQLVGTPSAAQTYTISGSNLVGNVTITAPTGYQISIDGGTTWTSSATLTPTSGGLTNVPVSVRLNAGGPGTFAGNILNASNGAATVNVPVNGLAVLPPTINTTTSSLSGFTQGTVKTYAVSGINLVANVTVTAPASYELSLDSTTWTTSPLVLTQSGGALSPTLIYVRLTAPGFGTYNGNIVHTSTNAATVNVALTGAVGGFAVTDVVNQFTQYMPAPSAFQSFLLTGGGITSTVTIAPPAKYQISLDTGRTWTWAPVTIIPTAGSVNTLITVRLYSGFAGIYNGAIKVTSTGAADYSIAVKGIATAAGVTASIYPVPSYDVIFVAHPVITHSATITIYNMAGQKLSELSAAMNAVETRINILSYPGGTYILVYDDGITRETLRFVKK